MLRYEKLKNVTSDVSPIHWQHGAIARLPKHAPIYPLLQDGYATITLGYIGVYECVKSLIGVSHTTPEGEKLAVEIVKYMKIVADSKVPFLKDVFEPYAEVVYIDGSKISHSDIIDADALIIRTRTRCDAALLDGTKVKMIATATIGTDHIDLDYCASHGIEVNNAEGCNAGGVMQYVFSALYGVAARKAIKLDDCTFGIIGVGHVGKLVEKMARYLGFKVLLCDPPRAKAEGPEAFCSLEYLLANSQIVTMHVPLDDSTRNMADKAFFDLMPVGSIFINASRGEVVDEEALMLSLPKFGAVIIDTWKNEPDINEELMDMVDIATPHIAGYSYQGKQNGTAASVRAVARHFGIEALYDFYPKEDGEGHEPMYLDLKGKKQGEVAAVFQYNYPIFTDDFRFRMEPGNFERMRSNYQYRREIYIEN
jgi:erythronate-4-phosphate dehydrogenase